MIQGEYRPLGSPVKEEHAGSRIDGYLSNLYPFYSRAGWQKRMKTGDVLVDVHTLSLIQASLGAVTASVTSMGGE